MALGMGLGLPGSRLVSTGPAFDPSTIGTLRVWLKADGDITLEAGNKVSEWGESGGILVPVQQTVDSNRPVYTADDGAGYKAVTFNGVDVQHLLSSPHPEIDSGNATDIMVFNCTEYNRRLISIDSSHGVKWVASWVSQFVDAGGKSRRGISTAELSERKILSCTITASTHASHRIFVDGVDRTGENDPGAPFNYDPSGLSTAEVVVGAAGDHVSVPYVGNMYEYLMYSPALSAENLQLLESHLGTKWGISVT